MRTPPTDPPAQTGEPQQFARMLPTLSIVEQTMAEARRALSLALVMCALVVTGLLAERGWFTLVFEAATARLALAQQLAGAIRLADQRLTDTAVLAVATGERRWVSDYDRHLADLAAAIDSAAVLLPPEVMGAFARSTQAARANLQDMRESAFEAVTVGDVAVARRIFDGARYKQNTALLAAAPPAFADSMVFNAQTEVASLRVRSYSVGTLVVLVTSGLGLTLWRRLKRRLEKSRSHLQHAEERMLTLASSDALTGLPNRPALHDAMQRALRHARRDGHGLGVMMVDLDRFKPVNDRHGHMVGDQVLQEVARRLTGCLRAEELCARFGGDEFVVVIDLHGDTAAATQVGERIIQVLTEPMLVDGLSINIGASVGVACYPGDAIHADDLLQLADSALYRAKARERGTLCFFARELDAPVAERHALEQAIRDGIATGQSEPFYQPIIELATGRIQALEMLCRWRHPKLGLLGAGDFIPLAEATGLMDPLLHTVMRRALAELQAFPPHWRLSVNLAPAQMLNPGIVDFLLVLLREHGVDPRRLDVELTESALVTDTALAMQVMRALKRAGLTVTLDDFGTGYSSLSYRSEMSFDKIKSDHSCILTLHERPASFKLIEAVLGLSRSLGVQAVAEGVETPEDAEVLARLGCPLVQGFLYGRPMPAQDLLAQMALNAAVDAGSADAGTAAVKVTAQPAHCD